MGSLRFSEPLDAFEYYQRIELEFTPVVGDAIRIRGTAGGRSEFTSILELEAHGLWPAVLPGDATGDDLVDDADYTVWADHYRLGGVAPFSEGGRTVGNFNEDAVVDGADYTIWADHFGESLGGAAPAPEPATMLWILLGAFPLLRRVRWGWPTARGP